MKKILLIGNDDRLNAKIGNDLYEHCGSVSYLIDCDNFNSLKNHDDFADASNMIIIMNSREFKKKNAIGVNDFIQFCNDYDIFPAFVSTGIMEMPNTMVISIGDYIKDAVHFLYNEDWKDYNVFLDVCKTAHLGEEVEDDNTLSSPERGE